MKGMNGMPPLGEMMTDRQVADVVNYVRSHFGNRYRDAVTPADAQALDRGGLSLVQPGEYSAGAGAASASASGPASRREASRAASRRLSV